MTCALRPTRLLIAMIATTLLLLALRVAADEAAEAAEADRAM